MRRDLFYYELPEGLIASQPTAERGGSRLLCLDGPTGQMSHAQFPDLLAQVKPGDLMVFNNTRVIPARLFGQKDTGGKVEVLVERLIADKTVLAHVRASKSPKPGAVLSFDQGVIANMGGRRDDLFELTFSGDRTALEILETIGHMPLPPYIQRADTETDRERYQTVYAQRPGAVAAPTAGLHFDDELLQQLRDKGVQTAFVTLHVGAGTFQPVRADNIQDHRMHAEVIEVTAEVCDQVKQTKAAGGRVIAVGTTSVRCLETAASQATKTQADTDNIIKPCQGETDIFIYPGYCFRVVDALLTNFHLPESTLLMLVCAFAGYRHTMQAYREAVDKGYRFFSYGGAMFITKNPQAPEELPQ